MPQHNALPASPLDCDCRPPCVNITGANAERNRMHGISRRNRRHPLLPCSNRLGCIKGAQRHRGRNTPRLDRSRTASLSIETVIQFTVDRKGGEGPARRDSQSKTPSAPQRHAIPVDAAATQLLGHQPAGHPLAAVVLTMLHVCLLHSRDLRLILMGCKKYLSCWCRGAMIRAHDHYMLWFLARNLLNRHNCSRLCVAQQFSVINLAQTASR